MINSIKVIVCKVLRPILSRQYAILKPSLLFTPSKDSFVSKYKISTPMFTIARNFGIKRHRKMVKLAKGYRGRANRCFSIAKLRVTKARQYAYRDRKVKKREFRKLWIQRINAGSRMYGIPYNHIVYGMNKANIKINRKVLADIAITEPLSFRSVVEISKRSLPKYQNH